MKKTKMINTENLKKKKIDTIVSAKVFSNDLKTLKDHEVNVSRLIRTIVAEIAHNLRSKNDND